MYEISEVTLRNTYKPFDIISDIHGNVGFIKEVSINDCQPDQKDQVSYAIRWLTGDIKKIAWFEHDELEYHCNLFIIFAENMCHPFGSNAKWVKEIFKLGLEYTPERIK